MKQYLNLLDDVIKNGEDRSDRTGVGTRSVFGRQMRFDLTQGLPLLTTKKLHIPSILHELLWFIRGEDNTKYLTDNGVTIWDEWADEEGFVGPMYGSQWRNWNKTEAWTDGADYSVDCTQIDQLQNAINTIKDDPSSRRIIVSAWNVADLDDMALNPCHIVFQFYCHGDNYEKLSLQLYQRSADVFLGVPYNIASYAFLLHMVAFLTGKQAAEFIWTGGDVHLYSNHFEQAVTQLNRKPKKLSDLDWGWIQRYLPPPYIATPTFGPLPQKDWNFPVYDMPKTIDEFTIEHFRILDYNPHPHIKAKVAV